MQKFDAQRLAIGAPQDGDDLVQRAEFEAEHVVEKDRAVEIGLGEPVGARIKLLLVVRRRQAERIEVGVEMAAGAIGADQHERAYRVAGRALDVGRGKRDAFRLRLRLHFAADCSAGLGPLPAERLSKVSGLGLRPARPGPGRAPGAFGHVAAVVFQALEERPPFRVDGGGIGFVASVKVFDISGIAAVQEGGESKGSVRVLARHERFPERLFQPGVALSAI